LIERGREKEGREKKNGSNWALSGCWVKEEKLEAVLRGWWEDEREFRW
jgi:hypothetical protein